MEEGRRGRSEGKRVEVSDIIARVNDDIVDITARVSDVIVDIYYSIC